MAADCPICGIECKGRGLSPVSRHLASKHDTSLEKIWLQTNKRPKCKVCNEPARWGRLEYQQVCGSRRCSGIVMRLNLKSDPDRYAAFVDKVKANMKIEWERNANRGIGSKPRNDEVATLRLLMPIDAFLNSNPTWAPEPLQRIING